VLKGMRAGIRFQRTSTRRRQGRDCGRYPSISLGASKKGGKGTGGMVMVGCCRACGGKKKKKIGQCDHNNFGGEVPWRWKKKRLKTGIKLGWVHVLGRSGGTAQRTFACSKGGTFDLPP